MLVKQGDLSIGISTGGASPSAAIYWKKQIAGLIPEDMAGMLAYLDGLREWVKRAVPLEKDRAKVFSRLFHICVEQGWPVEEKKLVELLGEEARL